MRILVREMMTTLFHENDCNFLCAVIMTEYNSLFKRTAGAVADSNSVAVTMSIYQLTVLGAQVLKPSLKQA